MKDKEEEFCVALTTKKCSLKVLQANSYIRRNQIDLTLLNAIKQSISLNSTHVGNTGFIVCQGTDDVVVSLRIAKYCNEMPMTRYDFWNTFYVRRKRFLKEFKKKFRIKKNSNVNGTYKTAIVALSNLLGGIGSFNGSYKVIDHDTRNIQTKIASLVSTTPSRVYHAHSYLWDEGFHNMVLAVWDSDLSLEILDNWLDLMDDRGWIPRELILDDYSKFIIPERFHSQVSDHANPSTLLYPLLYLAKKLAIRKDGRFLLKEINYKISRWIDWFIRSQEGSMKLSYRWRGRDLKLNENQTNKMTLPSGLDDYPRALDVDGDERHLDLRCWIAVAANLTAQIAHLAGEEYTRYTTLYKDLIDENKLDELHFDTENKRYGDYGADSKSTRSSYPFHKVINRIGYVCIFPFLLKLLHPESEKLKFIIDDIKQRDRLWTDFGLRSLSKTDEYYQQKNDISDKPQWRGSIRLNINYLALGALKFYASHSTKYKDEMQLLYEQLRKNILANVVRVYQKQGSFYEKYNDITGDGEGHYPHSSGSLFILVLSEKYF